MPDLSVAGFTRAEAIGLVLQSTDGTDALSVASAMQAVEDLDRVEAAEQRLPCATLTNAIRSAMGDTES